VTRERHRDESQARAIHMHMTRSQSLCSFSAASLSASSLVVPDFPPRDSGPAAPHSASERSLQAWGFLLPPGPAHGMHEREMKEAPRGKVGGSAAQQLGQLLHWCFGWVRRRVFAVHLHLRAFARAAHGNPRGKACRGTTGVRQSLAVHPPTAFVHVFAFEMQILSVQN